MNIYADFPRFAALFQGLTSAFGTGEGRWVKRPLRPEDWVNHLQGRGPGIGIAPLRPDNTVMFAAIDLDEPDFEAAREMQEYLPGTSFIERSRSGNAHVWVFFREPLEAWVAMGVLKEATLAAGKMHVEVFPKNWNFEAVRLGSYINLPYHGDKRPVFKRIQDAREVMSEVVEGREGWECDYYAADAATRADYLSGWFDGMAVGEARHDRIRLSEFLDGEFFTISNFVRSAEDALNDPEDWRRKARWLLISPPDQRERTAEFGKQANLHICAEHILEHADTNPVLEGHRSMVYFGLAKMLTNWREIDHDEALMLLRSVNEASPDRISDSELRRILGNAERGQFTSTGCDDPLFMPYAHPECPIAYPRS